MNLSFGAGEPEPRSQSRLQQGFTLPAESYFAPSHPQGASSLSFFDEADEPRTAVRRPASRSAPPRRRAGAGGGGRPRPPYDSETVRTRRFIALVVIIVLLVLTAVGVHACQVNQRNGALEDYNSN